MFIECKRIVIQCFLARPASAPAEAPVVREQHMPRVESSGGRGHREHIFRIAAEVQDGWPARRTWKVQPPSFERRATASYLETSAPIGLAEPGIVRAGEEDEVVL